MAERDRTPTSRGTSSRAAHRRSTSVRRSRLLVAGAAVVAALVVVAWFPAVALYRQHQELSSSTGQLDRLRSQNDALRQEAKRLESPAEVARIARQQYQLVDPGQQVYEVLPATSASGSADAGDPGQQPPVTPSGASELPPGSGGGSTSGAAHHGERAGRGASSAATGGSPGLLGRILDTLEFWR